ncbi:M67 family metallopeptidase [Moorellaceae bacterium AZ2]
MKLKRALFDQMVAHACASLPHEACGILAGQGGEILAFYPTSNTEKSPVRYNIDPQEMLKIFRQVEGLGWEVMGIFHSHPATEAYPSPTDIRLAFYPEALYFILSLKEPSGPQLRAFWIVDGEVREEPLTLV